MKSQSSTIDANDVARFAGLSDAWWQESGPFAPIHRITPARMGYLKSIICRHFERDEKNLQSLKNLQILDVGCGGGLACEPLARLGAHVTGIDADANAITVAAAHAEKENLKIIYKTGSAEDFTDTFDVVLALEIVEHVADVEAFVESCVALCRPGGVIIFSTLNKTLKSLVMAKIAAEYILHWVPAGTHDWRKFMRPSVLAGALRRHGVEPFDVTGLVFNPLQNDFALSASDFDVNYFIAARKPE